MEKEFKEGAEKVIRACGEIIRNADRNELGIESKEGHANFVTRYDALVQKELQQGLQKLRPGAAFLGEEGDSSDYPDAEEVFIVDPIDGTTNFMVGLDCSCISVALARKREVVYAAIYNPFTDAYYEAEKGAGAYRNHEPIRVSGEPLERAGQEYRWKRGYFICKSPRISEKMYRYPPERVSSAGSVQRGRGQGGHLL